MTSLRKQAVAYARNGLYVFPVGEDGKRPITTHGHRDATNDENVVDAWWRQHPHANIGVHARASGLLALDIDPRNGGSRTLRELERRHGSLPRAMWQRTPQHGDHIFFVDPSPGDEGWTRPASEGGSCRGGLGPGLDVKCNGYVLLWPSRTPRGMYEWASREAPRRLPDAWITVLRKTRPASVGDVAAWSTCARTNFDLTTLPRRLRTLAEDSRTVAHTTIRAVVLVFETAGLSIERGFSVLDEHYARHHYPEPLTQQQLMRQIEKIGAKCAGTGARMKVTVRR